jgi:predicted metallo-beta-lactamase superfamily hydrolase
MTNQILIDLAEENNHILITDFGYDRLVKFYDSVGDFKNKEKYQELYDSWKKKRETIEF